jgi:NADPH-dependent 7-cyano-7-deazaguanine reductase QueF
MDFIENRIIRMGKVSFWKIKRYLLSEYNIDISKESLVKRIKNILNDK